MKFRYRIQLAIIVVLALSITSCNVVNEISRAVTNLSRCTFKLAGVSEFRLAGVSLTGKTSMGLLDGAKVLASYAKNELPATFVLKVAAQNPNTGSNGTVKSTATLTRMSWTLLLDDAPTVSGDVTEPIEIPGTGEQKIIPIQINLDLLKFFNDRGYDKILKLALSLGGAQGSASRVTLRAKPTIKTDFGEIAYPGDIDLIDKEFRGQ
jgi:hypothetical protein